MNTKTTKLLAVLAVFAMAFAVVAVAESNEAATATTEKTITGNETLEDGKKYGVDLNKASADITLTIPSGTEGITIYVVPDSRTDNEHTPVKLTLTTLFTNATATSAPVTVYLASSASEQTVTYDDSYVVKFGAGATGLTTGAMTVTAKAIGVTIASCTLPALNAILGSATEGNFVMSGDVTLSADDAVLTIPATANFKGVVKDGTNSVTVATNSKGGLDTGNVTFTYAAGTSPAPDTMTLGGTVSKGMITVGAGILTVSAVSNPLYITGVADNAAASATKIYPTIASAFAAEATAPTILGSFTMSGNTPVTKSFSIANGCSLTIPERYTLTLDQEKAEDTQITITIGTDASIVNYGTMAGTSYTPATSNATTYYPIITGDELQIKPTGTLYGINCSAVTNFGDASADDASEMTGDYDVNENTTVTNLVVNGKLTVAAGVTLTVKGALVVGSMEINGKLVVTSSGSIGKVASTSVDDFKAKIGSKGSIVNDGVIGKNFAIKYYTKDSNYVTTAGVSGISVKYSADGPLVTGIAKAVSKAYNFDSTGAVIAKPYIDVNAAAIGDLNIPAGVTFKATTAASKVVGSMVIASNWTTITPASGSNTEATDVTIIVVAGGSITSTGAMTGTIVLGVEEELYSATVPDAGATIVTTAGVSGFTVKVVKETVVIDDDTTYYNYRAYMSGVLVSPAAETITKMTVTGIVWVSENLSIPSTLKMEVGTTVVSGFAVTGKITSTADLKDAVVLGATYSVTTDSTAVFYAVSVEDGLEALEAADNMTVTLHGEIPTDGHEYEFYVYEIPEDFMVTIGQILAFEGDYPVLYIPEGVSVGVQNQATFNADALVFIDGSLVVFTGGICNPDASIYDVTYYNEEYTVYCGFQTALDNAEPGDTIVFTNSKTFEGKNYLENLTIPEGVTLEIAGTIEVLKSVTVSKGATLEVTGNLVIGSDGSNVAPVSGVRFNVVGIADLTGGSTIVNGKDANQEAKIYSTGLLSYTSSTFTTNNAVKNGFEYFSTVYVLTSLELAVLSEKPITAYGEVTDLAEVALTANLTIDSEATNVILGIVAIDGFRVIADGMLTAHLTGTDAFGLDAAITVEDFIGTISDLKSTSGVYTMAISEFTDGNLGISTGSVAIAGNLEGDKIITMDGSALYIDNTADYKITTTEQYYFGDILISKGTLELNPETTVEVPIAISGDVIVSDVATLTISDNSLVAGSILVAGVFNNNGVMYLTGTLAIDDSDDSVAKATSTEAIIMGTPDVAAQGTITGKLVLSNTYILMFPGASVSAETLALAKYASDLYVNDELYCSVVTSSTNFDLQDVVEEMDQIEVEGYDMPDSTVLANWTDEDGKALEGTETIGAVDAYLTGTLAEIPINITWPKGLSLYIDGVRVTGLGELNLTYGIHLISVTVDAGYACDNIGITYNGVAITPAGIFVEADDAGSVLAVTGDVYIPEPEPVTPEEKSEWTITTILLVILVILIAVMAVIVALRLNRS